MSTPAPPAPVSERLVAAIGATPFTLSALAAVLAVGGFLGIEVVSGRFALATGPNANPDLAQDLRIAIPLLLALAYLPGATLHAARAARATWRELAPQLEAPGEVREALLAAAGRYDPAALRRYGTMGVAIALLLQTLSDLNPRETFDLPSLPFEALVHRLAIPVIGWLAGRFFASLWMESTRLSQAGREHLRIDPLDLSTAKPIAQHGIRGALLAALPLSLVALMGYDADAGAGLRAVLLLLFPLNAMLAALLLTRPMRGVRDAVRDAKRHEIDWCNAEIRRRRGALERGAAEGSDLAELVAYKEHVADQREWPVDLSTAARFGLALALPLGSWLGGAMVERAVDYWLR